MKKKNKATKKWRRINPYICEKCHKRRLTFFFQRAEAKICAKCSKDEVPDNQPSLFCVIPVEQDPEVQDILNKHCLKEAKKLAQKYE